MITKEYAGTLIMIIKDLERIKDSNESSEDQKKELQDLIDTLNKIIEE